MATSAPMLPGLGGGTGGVQLVPNNPIPAAKVSPVPTSANNFATQGNTTLGNVPGTSIPVSPTDTPANLPSPQMTDNLSPTGNTTALPGQNAPAGTPVTLNQPNGSLIPGLTPMTVTDLMNQPPNPVPAGNAAQFGTAAQTPDATKATADKMNAAFKSVKDTTAPTNKGDAAQMVQNATDQNTPQNNPDPIASAMDAYGSMNPVVKQMFDNIQTILSAQASRQSLVEQFQKIMPDPGVASLSQDQLNLINIKNLMSGNKDAVVSELSKVGAPASEAQINLMTAARNKIYMQQAQQLQDVIQMKEDYVKQIMTLTEADQAEADKQVSEQLGLDEKVAELTLQMDQAAKDNYFKQLQLQQTQDAAQVGQYDKNLTNLGGDYTAFASTIPDGMKAKVESLMGLAPGTLSNPSELAYLTASSLKQQQLAQAGQKIQISLNNAGSLDQYRQALTDLAGARTVAAQANAVNSTIKSLYGTANANPITAYRTASIWIGNVNAAYAKSIDPSNVNKGPSDLELIDAAVKLNNGGQQVTQVQVDALQQAIGYPGKITVAGGKVTGISGLLDNGTRTAIRDLATSNLIQKRIAATDATSNINSTLTSRGVPSNYNLPDIQAAMIPQGAVNTGTAADGMTTVYLLQDGSIVDANGATYDSDGNPL